MRHFSLKKRRQLSAKFTGPWDALRETEPVVAVASRLSAVGISAALVMTLGMALFLGISRVRTARSPGQLLRRLLLVAAPPALFATAVTLHATVVRSG